MAAAVVEAIVDRFSVGPGDHVEVTDVAIAPSVPKISFWCRFDIFRESGGSLESGALLAWFLAEGLPPVLQFYTQSSS